jgi:hypothetical protein
MAAAPDCLTLERHRDLVGRRDNIWIRRGLVAVLVAFLLAGLANVFGQRPWGESKTVPGVARLTVYAPVRLRSGLYFEARFHIDALKELKDARLVLSADWMEGMTINTIVPSPLGEASANGDLSLDLGHIPKGKKYLLFLQFQVNPTNVGRRSQDVVLFDGKTRLAAIDRTMTIFP